MEIHLDSLKAYQNGREFALSSAHMKENSRRPYCCVQFLVVTLCVCSFLCLPILPFFFFYMGRHSFLCGNPGHIRSHIKSACSSFLCLLVSATCLQGKQCLKPTRNYISRHCRSPVGSEVMVSFVSFLTVQCFSEVLWAFPQLCRMILVCLT